MGEFTILQTYCFLEFFDWCAKNYLLETRVVVFENGLVLFHINAESIINMLSLPKKLEGQTLNEYTLSTNYQDLMSQEKFALLQSYMDNNVVITSIDPPYKSKIFLEISRQDLMMMCLILGHDDDRIIDEDVLEFLSSILPTNGSYFTKFHYVQFLIDIIHY